MAKQFLKLDKYAQDPRAWLAWGKHNYMASTYLFESHNPFLIFAAATLGHHALEMFLKAALVQEGVTIFNPRKLRDLDPSVRPDAKDCAWDHGLVVLAHQLAARRPDFDLSEKIDFLMPWHVPTQTMCVVPTLEQAFELFDPFFSELRYPQELTMGGVGEDDKIVLDKLVKKLEPFLPKIK
jgi:hypothetical protein